MENNTLSLKEFNMAVSRVVRQAMPAYYWVRAELSEVRPNRSGHCYVELVEKDSETNYITAKARGNIWRNYWAAIQPAFEQQTGMALQAGIKVLVRVQVNFHELYGYSLTISDIDPSYTMGDMARKRKEILDRLSREGVAEMNKGLNMAMLPQRVAVISSDTAAGYGDFRDQLLGNPYGIQFHTGLFSAVMQGEATEKSVIAALDKITSEIDNWDVVVIIRGGGSTSDLSGFDSYLLAANIAQFPLPVITGIGHERDETVLDYIAHTRVKTPTAAAEFLVTKAADAAMRLDDLSRRMSERVGAALEQEKYRGETLARRLNYAARDCTRQAGHSLDIYSQRLRGGTASLAERHRSGLSLVETRLKSFASALIERQKSSLALIEEKIRGASPEEMLRRGYSISTVNGRTPSSVKDLKPGEILTTVFKDGKIESIIK